MSKKIRKILTELHALDEKECMVACPDLNKHIEKAIEHLEAAADDFRHFGW